jgi:hypothetical protein
MVSCPRYYAFKTKVQVNYKKWIQQALPFLKTIKTITIQETHASFEKSMFNHNLPQHQPKGVTQ